MYYYGNKVCNVTRIPTRRFLQTCETQYIDVVDLSLFIDE